jgi:hypothetical protein
MMMRCAIALVVFLSACSTTPPVRALGNDRFSTDADAHTVNAARTEAMKQASAFCTNSGKALDAESSSDQSISTLYRSNVVFSCH